MEKQHIIMFPYMAQGHLIPFLSLAKLISQRFPDLTITIVNTPLNVKNLSSSLSPNLYPNINFHSLPFRSSDFNLPPESENTDSLPTPLLLSLFQASESLQPDFTRFVSGLVRSGSKPVAIVADVFFGWTVEVAGEFNIFHACFTTCGAYGTAVYFSLWLHLPHLRRDLPEFGLPGFPESFKLDRSQLSIYMKAADGKDGWSRFFQRQISHSLKTGAMLCNTVEGMEIQGLRLLGRITGLRVRAIGPLLPLDSSSSKSRSGKSSGTAVEEIMDWLDSRRESSVVYVSFGSQNTISSSQMMSLAIGLEASGHSFIWVIRPPVGFDLNSDLRSEWLPDGFEGRMRENKRGLLVRRWAPQLEILSHKSTGAFLSHCGWNSILESLSRGVAIVGWPLASEQFYNIKMVQEELGAGVELARGLVDEVKSEAVERMLKLVMEGGKGMEMKAKATRFKEIIQDSMKDEGENKGSSIREVDEFISNVISVRNKE